MTINDGRLIVDLFPGVFLWMELTSSTLIELSYIYSLASLDSPSLRQQFTMTRFTLPGYDVTERKVMLETVHSILFNPLRNSILLRTKFAKCNLRNKVSPHKSSRLDLRNNILHILLNISQIQPSQLSSLTTLSSMVMPNLLLRQFGLLLLRQSHIIHLI